MRILAWIPLVTLAALGVVAWIAMRSEVPFEFAFNEPPRAPQVSDPLPPTGAESLAGTIRGESGLALRETLVATLQNGRLIWSFTDDAGRFQLDELEPGTHELTVVARGYPPRRVDATTGSGLLEVDLEERTPLSPSVDATATSPFTARVAAPAPDVRYELLLDPLDDDLATAALFPRRSSSGVSGEFDVPDLAHGRYRVIVLPDWARGGSWPDLTSELDGPGLEIEHPDDGAALLALASGEIRGRVTERSLHTDSPRGSDLVEGALVLVRPAGDPASGVPDPRLWPPLETDVEGTFLVRDLPAGRYRVTIHAGTERLEREVVVHAESTTSLDL